MKNICKILFVIFIFAVSALDNSYAAEVIEDDSVPYMPYPERVETVKPAPEPTKKAPAKQTTTKTKKKNTTKKTPAKKKSTATAKKNATPKISSLERGIALMKAERYEAAKPYLLKAIQEERNNPNAWYWYGVYHEKTGGFYQAQYFYSKAVTIDPAFEPLSRVVYYPEDAEKTPLWDPKRPARVYPVATANDGMAIGRGNFPSAPNDPEIPKVPVYTPPEPDANPMDGDAWSPAVYVPPMPEEAPVNNGTPVYNPPKLQRVEAELPELPEITQGNLVTENNYSYKIPGYSNTYTNSENNNVRVDTPLYNPPEPGQVIAKTPKQPAPVIEEEVKPAPAKKTAQVKSAPRKVVKKTEKNEPKKQAKNTKNSTKTVTTEKKKAQVKTENQTKTQVKPTTKTTKPKTETPKPAAPKTPDKPKPEPEKTQQKKAPEPVKPPEPEKKVEPVKPVEQPKQQVEPEQARQSDYLPPVGQTAPDPGTVPETSEVLMPPVGQGSQY